MVKICVITQLVCKKKRPKGLERKEHTQIKISRDPDQLSEFVLSEMCSI